MYNALCICRCNQSWRKGVDGDYRRNYVQKEDIIIVGLWNTQQVTKNFYR